MIPVPCIGAWGGCNIACRNTYTIVQEASGGGDVCGASDGQSEECEAGDGLCEAVDDSVPAPPPCTPNTIVLDRTVIQVEYKVEFVFVLPNVDCAGEQDGGLVNDACGICNGTNSTCLDCAAVPGGNASTDRCGICNTDPTDDCVQDCKGDWGGPAVDDICNLCEGDNSTCNTRPVMLTVPGASSCPATPGDIAAMKASIAAQYGLADASAIDLNCGGGGRRRLQSGGLVIAFKQDLSAPEVSESDMQSISGLEAAAAPATVFDCFGEEADASTMYQVNDACGVCNGTNVSCSDCAGVPNGLSTVDGCLVCDANATNDCPQDCEGVWGGPSFYDACLVCNGGHACKVCPAGTEKCAARVRCTGGCKSCASNAVSLPGTLCSTCGDGKEPSQAKENCAWCAQGTAGVGGACASCASGMQPNADSSACISCPFGTYKDTLMAKCEFCVAGAEPTFDRTLCQFCALGHYSSANDTVGLCAPCPAGTQPTNSLFENVRAGGSVCSACTVGQFSMVEASIGAAYECIKCVDVVSSGMTTRGPGSKNASACVCLSGKYDRTIVGAVVYGHPSSYNDTSSRALMDASGVDIDEKAICIQCPADSKFIQCEGVAANGSVVAGEAVISAGFAELNLNHSNHSNHSNLSNSSLRRRALRLVTNQSDVLANRHFFKCAFGKTACKSFSVSAAGETLEPTCEYGYTGLLCGECMAGFALSAKGCIECDATDTVWFLVGYAMAAAVAAYFVLHVILTNCSEATRNGVLLCLGVTQRIWPRLNQSLKLFIANIQIISRFPVNLGIELPGFLKTVLDVLSEIVDGAAEALPGVACAVGGTFPRRLMFKVALPAGLLFGILVSYYVRVFLLKYYYMPIRYSAGKSFKAKITRAVVRMHLRESCCNWAFAIVYLLYPSTSTTILETFYCRKITDDGLRVLMADYSIMCFDNTGSLEPGYLPLLASGLTLAVLWSIGIPAFFAHTLFKNRELIKSNPKHASLSAFRPMFIFFKPDCYMFEPIFLYEKLILNGVVRILNVYVGGFMVTNFVSMIVTVTMLCVICAYQPSKTQPYNIANIASHVLMLVMLMMSIILKFPEPEDAWATPAMVGLALGGLQMPFWAYLAKVSIGKIRVMYRESKAEMKLKLVSKSKLNSKSMRERHFAQSNTGELRLSVKCARGVQRVPFEAGQAKSGGYYLVVQCGLDQQSTGKKGVSEAVAVKGLDQGLDVQAAVWDHTCVPFTAVSRSSTVTFRLYWRHWATETDAFLAEQQMTVASLVKTQSAAKQKGAARATSKYLKEPNELGGRWHTLRSKPKSKSSTDGGKIVGGGGRVEAAMKARAATALAEAWPKIETKAEVFLSAEFVSDQIKKPVKVTTGLQELYLQLQEAKKEMQVRSVDESYGKATVSFKETAEEIAEFDELDMELDSLVHDKFDELDKDGDGKLDRDELMALAKDGKATKEMIDKFMSAADGDGDGLIEKAEAETLWLARTITRNQIAAKQIAANRKRIAAARAAARLKSGSARGGPLYTLPR